MMASVFGISVTGLKKFQGTEWEGFNANIRLGKKQIGSAINSGDGGITHFYFQSQESKEEFQKRRVAYFEKCPSKFPDDEIFLEDVIILTERERRFKKQSKWAEKNYGSDPRLSVSMVIEDIDPYNHNEYIVFSEEQLEKLKSTIATNGHKITAVYKREEDFIIN